MASRKPKEPPKPISPYHPLKLSCPTCLIEPFLLCVECGAEWADSFKKIHRARIEAYELQVLFEEE